MGEVDTVGFCVEVGVFQASPFVVGVRGEPFECAPQCAWWGGCELPGVFFADSDLALFGEAHVHGNGVAGFAGEVVLSGADGGGVAGGGGCSG